MNRPGARLPVLLALFSLSALVACRVMVGGPSSAASGGAGYAAHGEAPTGQPGEVSGHSACAVHTGTGCYWMEDYSGHYCWVPADLAESFEDCHAMDSCDGGQGESNGGCYKWAASSDGERTPWPGQ